MKSLRGASKKGAGAFLSQRVFKRYSLAKLMYLLVLEKIPFEASFFFLDCL